MSTTKSNAPSSNQVPKDLANYLGVRRTMTLKRIMRQTGLPPEALLDLALEMLDIASRKLSPSPIQRHSVPKFSPASPEIPPRPSSVPRPIR